MSLQGQGDEIQIIDNVACFYFWLNWWPWFFNDTPDIFLQLTLVLMMMMMMIMMMMLRRRRRRRRNADRDDSDEDEELSESVMTSTGR